MSEKDNDLAVLSCKTEKVETRKGVVVVRELVVEDVVGLTDALTAMFKDIDMSAMKSSSSTGDLIGVLGKSNMLSSVKKVLAVVTDSPDGFFDRFPLLDVLKVVLAFLRVNNWEELKALFFEIRRLVANKEQAAEKKE